MMLEIITVCPFCGEEHSIMVPSDGYVAWQFEGENIQDALPHALC